LQYRFIYGNPSAVISTSELTNKAIAEKLAVKPEKIHLVRYGMQTEIYQENKLIIKEIREKYRANEKIVVGTLARITPLKGVQDLAEAYEFLPEKWKDKIVFWLIGEPSILKRNGEQIIYEQEDEILDKSIRDFIEKYNLQEKVRRIGFQKNYIDFLGAMDIFVLASHNEMYALSMIEAMLMQKAVIGTQGGGTPEQVAQEQRGLLVPIRSPKAIAEAIVRYVESPELAKKMAENARLWALENHSWKKTLLAYQKIYEA
ncbi:MAG: glycosyltransferase family 4 protein, partial [Thermonemataceae bacterium]|nr:glycosyltransferase family 4 protein [Thermonemataceae bacterium]